MCNNVVRAQSFSAKKVLKWVVYFSMGVGVLGELAVERYGGLFTYRGTHITCTYTMLLYMCIPFVVCIPLCSTSVTSTRLFISFINVN